MKTILTFFVLVLCVGCVKTKTNLETEKLSIINCWTDWGSKAEAGDPGYYWANDVVIMGSLSPTIKGKEKFMEIYSSMSNSPGFSLVWDKEPSTIEISDDGKMAYLFAKNRVSFIDSTGTTRNGVNQAIQIWKKDKEGNWKATVSIMYPDPETVIK